MPKLNGYEVCRRIRETDWGKKIVLIAQTGWGQDEDKRRTREAGFDASSRQAHRSDDRMKLVEAAHETKQPEAARKP